MSSGPGRWRSWQLHAAVIAFVLLGGVLVALLSPAAATSYLNPSGTGPLGAHALADLLTGRGHRVIAVSGAAAAASAAGTGHPVLVITGPQELARQQLVTLAAARADLVIVGPDARALAVLAPAVTLAGPPVPVQPRQPGCALTAARLAGTTDLGGAGFTGPGGPRTAACYQAAGYPLLVRYTAGGRTVTILASGDLLANGLLANGGNAALALNLIGTRHRIVWLTPPPVAPVTAAGGSRRSVLSLLPFAAYLVVVQLAIAAVCAALWRARRLGPLVSEQLPVVIRASETVEGHGGLYQARRARAHAAAALREAALARLRAVTGLQRGALPAAITAALAARTRLAGQDVEARLFGAAPATDAALASLADDLDALEREVRAQ